LNSEREYEENSLVVTNYSKFLKFRSANWDLVIIDDSHSFETVKEQAFQYAVNYRLIHEIYEQYEDVNILGDFLGTFLDIFDDIFETALPRKRKQGPIGSDYVSRMASEVLTDEQEQQLKERIQLLPERDRQICDGEWRFISACKEAANHNFYLRKDWFSPEAPRLAELIAREVEETINFKVTDRFRDARVIMATATPGDPEKHAQACTNRDYDDSGLGVVPQTMQDQLRDWFSNLDIYSISDLGDTRNQQYLMEFLRLAADVIRMSNTKTILLFKNYNDQRTARDFLENEFDDIYFVGREDDEDTIHEYASRKQIIIASASTRLWEGISIDDLGLGIIFTPPFIRVPVHIPTRRSFPYNLRIMLRRLQQGIGRLVRDEGDEGVCLLMDENFAKYLRMQRFAQALRERVHQTDSSNAVAEIRENTHFGE